MLILSFNIFTNITFPQNVCIDVIVNENIENKVFTIITSNWYFSMNSLNYIDMTSPLYVFYVAYYVDKHNEKKSVHIKCIKYKLVSLQNLFFSLTQIKSYLYHAINRLKSLV